MINPYIQALDFLVDAGVSVAVQAEPNNRFESTIIIDRYPEQSAAGEQQRDHKIQPKSNIPPLPSVGRNDEKRGNSNDQNEIRPHADIIKQAEELAAAAQTIDDLKTAKTASGDLLFKNIKGYPYQMVFNPKGDLVFQGNFTSKLPEDGNDWSKPYRRHYKSLTKIISK